MPLAANSKLGPYEIRSTLGTGGMGEVYRARDSRLNRDVAIKVLRAEGASAELRSRFEREARAVAALNHPNIIAIYDFGTEAGRQYIVSELLEGASLRLLLHGEPIPVRRLIEIASQVADGLASAHAAGIIHRDLKPENIMLSRDGRVKILDFGLARHDRTTGALRPAAGDEETVAPTGQTRHLTSEGTILGTANYMSPEQALCKEVDYRSDQFSFGLILHEMASGKQAFARSSSVETMAAIVRDEPSAIEEKVPPPLKWIIDRCLNKEPEQRYESTRDLYRDLFNLRDRLSESYAVGTLAAKIVLEPKRRQWKLPALLAACTLLMAALAVSLLRPSGQDLGQYRYTRLASDGQSGVWSPDGKAVAYSGQVDGIGQVFLRFLNSSAAIQLTHGRKSMRPLGWSSDRGHLIIAESSTKTRIYSLATVGGEPDYIMDANCDACDLSRDGRTFATYFKQDDGNFGIATSDPLGSPLKKYEPAPFAAKESYDNPMLAFSADGKNLLLCRRGPKIVNEFWQIPYPAESGSPALVHINQSALTEGASGTWMPDNRNILISVNTNSPGWHLALAEPNSGKLQWLTTGPISEYDPLPSPDGKGILFVQNRDQGEVISASLDSGSTQTLVSGASLEITPTAPSMGSKMAWVSTRSGHTEIWLRSADGSERPVVTDAEFASFENPFFMNPTLSPDGNRVAYVAYDGHDLRLWLSSLSGGAPIRVSDAKHATEYGGAWSPDGIRFTYLQIRNDQLSLMTIKTTGNATPSTLKDKVAYYLPDWSPTGDWISYRDAAGWNMISPGGKTTKFLGKIETPYLTFSRSGSLLYGVETPEDQSGPVHALLFSLEVQSLRRRPIKELGATLVPATSVPPFRFSLSGDGKSLLFSTFKHHSDLWMLRGYRQAGLRNWLSGSFLVVNH